MDSTVRKLYTEEGFSQSEIARELGVSSTAIMNRLRKLGLSGVDRFKKGLGSDFPFTRKQAQVSGSVYYFTGKPCSKGHISKRYTSTGQCFDCMNAYNSTEIAIAARGRYGKSDKGLAASRNWAQNLRSEESRIRGREKARLNERRKYNENAQFKLRKKLRCRQGEIFRDLGVRRTGSFVRDLGLSIGECVAYIENHFNWQPHFSWENWGTVWELDHVKALGLFDLTDREQFLQAVHYTNLQPLSIEDHKEKTKTDRRSIRLDLIDK